MEEEIIAKISLKYVEDFCNKYNVGIISTFTKGENDDVVQKFDFTEFNLFEKGEQVCVKMQEDVKNVENAEEYSY